MIRVKRILIGTVRTAIAAVGAFLVITVFPGWTGLASAATPPQCVVGAQLLDKHLVVYAMTAKTGVPSPAGEKHYQHVGQPNWYGTAPGSAVPARYKKFDPHHFAVSQTDQPPYNTGVDWALPQGLVLYGAAFYYDNGWNQWSASQLNGSSFTAPDGSQIWGYRICARYGVAAQPMPAPPHAQPSYLGTGYSSSQGWWQAHKSAIVAVLLLALAGLILALAWGPLAAAWRRRTGRGRRRISRPPARPDARRVAPPSSRPLGPGPDRPGDTGGRSWPAAPPSGYRRRPPPR